MRTQGTVLRSQTEMKVRKIFKEHESLKRNAFPLKASVQKGFRSGTSIWTILTSELEQEFQMFEHYGHQIYFGPLHFDSNCFRKHSLFLQFQLQLSRYCLRLRSCSTMTESESDCCCDFVLSSSALAMYDSCCSHWHCCYCCCSCCYCLPQGCCCYCCYVCQGVVWQRAIAQAKFGRTSYLKSFFWFMENFTLS